MRSGPERTRHTTSTQPLLQGLAIEFLAARRAEIRELEGACHAGAFDIVEQIAHRLHGSGGSLGFPLLTEIGARLEIAAGHRDADVVAREIRTLARYLEEIDVVSE